MTEDKQTYKRVLLIFVAILSIYGAYSSGNKYNYYFYNKESLKQLNSSECVTADNLSFDNSDSDIKNIDNIDSRISYDNFLKLKMGMSYDKVKDLIGDGELTTESSVANSIIDVYSYINKDGSSANFTFDNGSLRMKSQYSLK